jgi:hypothetical protein
MLLEFEYSFTFRFILKDICLFKPKGSINKMAPRQGIEPRSLAWQAGILTTILSRNCYDFLLKIIFDILSKKNSALKIWSFWFHGNQNKLYTMYWNKYFEIILLVILLLVVSISKNIFQKRIQASSRNL